MGNARQFFFRCGNAVFDARVAAGARRPQPERLVTLGQSPQRALQCSTRKSLIKWWAVYPPQIRSNYLFQIHILNCVLALYPPPIPPGGQH